MKEKEHAIFYVKDENGNKVKAGIITFTEGDRAYTMEVAYLKDDKLPEIIATQPDGGYIITDGYSGGRIEVVTTDMQVRYTAITGAIDAIRERCHIPLIAPREKDARIIPVKRNPTRS